MRSSGQFGPHRESSAQWTGWGDWRLFNSAIDAMGMAQGINGLDRNPDAGFSVIASEFVKLGLKAIGSSDAFAEICFQYIKTQNRENFAKQFSGDCRSGGQSLSLKSDAFALSSCKLPVVEKNYLHDGMISYDHNSKSFFVL